MKTPLMIPHSRNTCKSRPAGLWGSLSPEDAESLLEQYSHGDSRKPHALRDFLASRFTEEKLKVMNSLLSCKTGKLGYTLTRCDTCGRIGMHACACGSRNCPSCGYLNEKRWVALRQAEVIPGIPYFHLVFTLPHDLSQIMYQNQRETLNLLFHSARDTVLTLSRDKLKMKPGILMVLHSFGSELSLHYHVHMLVTGGGLTEDGKDFKRCLSNTFFLPVRSLARVYKGKFMDGLKQLRSDNRLEYYNDALKYRNSYTWKELLNSCYKADWNVEIKYLAPVPPVGSAPSAEESTDNAIAYFSRYTNRTAISDSRIEGYDEQGIRFRYKKYDGSSYTMGSMHLTSDEFIRRFLMHILPAGFARIRYAGFMAGCVRRKNLELVHELLGVPYRESPVKGMGSADLILHFYGRDITVCEKCHSKLETYPRMSRISAAMFIRAS